MNRIDKLHELIQQTPNDCFLHHAIALEYLKNEEIDKALTHFSAVLKIDENYVGTYYHLAKLYEKINEINKAIEIYQKGLEIALMQRDNHARNELQMALNDIIDE